jgi:exodeoxyribonuclease VII small subunit
MSKKKSASAEASLSSEQSLEELEQIVAKLESGKLGLADSLAAYERGVTRLNGCYQMLTVAERCIELVQSVDAEGKAKTKPFVDDDADDLSEKSAARSRRRTAATNDRPSRIDDASNLF